ncbi:HK97 family phage prohead protease [Fodinibius sp. SL11]|uniref:HK97 family phage prohead protease n=1 Tax=Fodinibius sp. SL11 TaxID=3425690 RepID=UPI003F88373D
MEFDQLLPEEGSFYPWAHPRCIRRSSDNSRTIVTINTDAKDRHGTIIDPEGGNIEAYRQNPVFLINHDHNMVAGNGSNVRFQNGQWIAEINDEDWDLEDEEIAKWHNKVKKGIVRMASIGFMPLAIERITEEDEEGNEERKVIIREWEMLEWSFTPIGSNPEALVQQRSASIEQRELAGKLTELEKEINALKNGGLRLSDEQIDQIAQRISNGTASTPPDSEEDQPDSRESNSASDVLEYVEPRKHDNENDEPVYQSPREIAEAVEQKIKRKQGKA